MKKALIITRVSGFVPQFEMGHVRILQEMGYEVHYAANFETIVYGKNNDALKDTGIICHHIPFCRSPFSPAVSRCYRELRELMETEDFSLIHCHMPITGILGRMAAKKVRKLTGKKVPVLYTAHGFHFYKGAPLPNWIYYIPEKYYAKYTDRLILMNQEDYQRAQKMGVRGKVCYIPGVGLKDFPEPDTTFDFREMHKIPAEDTLIVSVGEITNRKNHRVMIQAMDHFRDKPVTYVICGSGPIEDELKAMVREMKLEKKVIFAGYNDKIPDTLRQADIFAFPSKQEGLPVAMMEAMQAGLPVLAADIRGNNDLIVENQGGLLFAENRAEDYIKGIEHLLANPDEAKKMGAWNQLRVKDFSVEASDAIMKEIYKEVENGTKG